jgi:hypothetical protein
LTDLFVMAGLVTVAQSSRWTVTERKSRFQAIADIADCHRCVAWNRSASRLRRLERAAGKDLSAV